MGRWIDHLHDHRATMVPKPHVTTSAWFGHEFDPIGEPLTYLIRLCDGVPHHLYWSLDKNLALNHQVSHQIRTPHDRTATYSSTCRMCNLLLHIEDPTCYRWLHIERRPCGPN